MLTIDGRRSTKSQRVALLRATPSKNLPSSYLGHTTKETICNDYVTVFASKFHSMFPHRRKLLLMPENEYGVHKLICTTIRKSLLPYGEIYDVQAIATFVSRYIQHEPLETPNEFPTVVPSPSQVLEWKCGDCFDCAILLTSLMLGAGYDAYVVSGYAPAWVRMGDQSATICPLLNQASPISKHLSQDEEVNLARVEPASLQGSEELGALDLQLHAWVMIKGTHGDLHHSIFMEPSTGSVFPIKKAPYSGVEAIFNAQNYWINMQDIKIGACSIDYDLRNAAMWEFIFTGDIPLPARTASKDVDIHPNSSLETTDSPLTRARTDEYQPEIPFSWVSKLALDVNDFFLRFPPEGQRTIFYYRTKLELFSENRHAQGITTRLSVYLDESRTILVKLIESFANRLDLLETRVRCPHKGNVLEEFLPGRAFSLKRLSEDTGKRRDLEFYVEARQDGLVSRSDVFGQKITERFESRSDGLLYRSVSVHQDTTNEGTKPQYSLPCGESARDLAVRKMTQKFNRLPNKENQCGISKRIFYVQEGRIKTQQHYETHRVTRQALVHIKDGDKYTRTSSALPDHSTMFSDDIGIECKDTMESMQIVLAAERDCLTEIRRSQLENLELMKLRRREETKVNLVSPIHETVRESNCLTNSHHNSNASQASLELLEIDYLSPFLQNGSKNSPVDSVEAQRARDSCLRHMKERLIERANIIMTRLNEENAKLAKRQATSHAEPLHLHLLSMMQIGESYALRFQRSQREHDPSSEEDFERFCSETMFRIQILENRLTSHQENAIKKFQQLDAKLRDDPRLRMLAAP